MAKKKKTAPRAVKCAADVYPENPVEFGEVPPSEFMLIPMGEYRTRHRTDKGIVYSTFIVDEESAASIVANFTDLGHDMLIDYEHANEYSTGPRDGGEAAGWIPQIEVREDGIYAVDVKWTEDAADLLRARKYRYHSPVYYFDPETNRVLSIEQDSLVNDPASIGAVPLAAKATATSGGDPTPEDEEVNPMSDALIKALDVKDESEAIAAVVELKAAKAKYDVDTEKHGAELAEAKTKIEAGEKLVSDIMAAVKCEDRAAVLGACKAAFDKAEKADEYAAKIKEIEDANRAKEKDALIAGAKVAGPITDWLKEQDLDTVKSYLARCDGETAPPMESQAASAVDTPPVSVDDSDREKMIAYYKKQGMSEEDAVKRYEGTYLKTKATLFPAV